MKNVIIPSELWCSLNIKQHELDILKQNTWVNVISYTPPLVKPTRCGSQCSVCYTEIWCRSAEEFNQMDSGFVHRCTSCCVWNDVRACATSAGFVQWVCSSWQSDAERERAAQRACWLAVVWKVKHWQRPCSVCVVSPDIHLFPAPLVKDVAVWTLI